MVVFAFIQELAQACIYYFFANSFYNVLKYSDLFYIATQKGKAKILIDPISSVSVTKGYFVIVIVLDSCGIIVCSA
jgi:hypothetical protein